MKKKIYRITIMALAIMLVFIPTIALAAATQVTAYNSSTKAAYVDVVYSTNSSGKLISASATGAAPASGFSATRSHAAWLASSGTVLNVSCDAQKNGVWYYASGSKAGW